MKEKQINIKKVLISVFIHICWFVPVFASLSSIWLEETVISFIIVDLGLLILVSSLYLSNNEKLKLSLLVLVTAAALIYNFRYVFVILPVFFAICIYKSHIANNSESEERNRILFNASVIINAVGIIVNLKQAINRRHELEGIIFLWAALFAFFVFALVNLKKCSDLFDEKTNDFYQKIFFISASAMFAGLFSRDYTSGNSIVFYPWVLFISVLMFENDPYILFLSDNISKKIKAFLK